MPQYTTLSTEELTHILKHYEIGSLIKLEDIQGGYGNSNFKLATTEGTFLLKICDEKNVDQLKMQVQLLDHLQQYAYPTVYPILQKNREALLISDKFHVMIYPFLNGGTPQPNKQVSTQIGAALGKLHSIPPLPDLPCFPMGISEIIPFLEEVKVSQFSDHPFVIWLKSELEWIQPELSRPLPTGLLHGDLFLDNTLFDGDKMVAIIDFEEVCYDKMMIDVGITIIGCCYTAQHQLDPVSVHGFLETYNAIRSMTDAEWDSLDCYVHYAALCIAFWRFRQFNIRHPDESSADKYFEMIMRSANWQSIRL